LTVSCLKHPLAKNQIFLASDGADVSTSELLRLIGKALNKPAKLIPLPKTLFHWIFVLLNKQSFEQRLIGSLQVDSSKANRLLGWKPVITLEAAIQKTVDHYLSEKK
ncbi:MAG: UDP-glucose 4-epimerase, partial [SAR324 cluster bacterium]|nr:UDP-glucose 4-epimerase [SAR324 cluster bacterium]